ncbi:MAG: prepilin-type N-terminal cleavage/methylation domain-containing protein [Clostridia bacterium]|nr:prepilin-type N-terminal cleavage/methylation domain-containing protein [Clostridia bacterium]
MKIQVVRKSRGFTLVEVLVATLILSIALVPLLGLFAKGARVSAAGWVHVTATSLAQGEMERLKRAPFRSLANADYRNFEAPFEEYTRRVEVAEVGPDLVEVKITVQRLGVGDDDVFVLQARRARR